MSENPIIERNTKPENAETESFEHDIFISYSHQDTKQMEIVKDAIETTWQELRQSSKFKKELKERQIKIWTDVENILAGDDWYAKIVSGIKRSRRVLSLISKHYTQGFKVDFGSAQQQSTESDKSTDPGDTTDRSNIELAAGIIGLAFASQFESKQQNSVSSDTSDDQSTQSGQPSGKSEKHGKRADDETLSLASFTQQPNPSDFTKMEAYGAITNGNLVPIIVNDVNDQRLEPDQLPPPLRRLQVAYLISDEAIKKIEKLKAEFTGKTIKNSEIEPEFTEEQHLKINEVEKKAIKATIKRHLIIPLLDQIIEEKKRADTQAALKKQKRLAHERRLRIEEEKIASSKFFNRVCLLGVATAAFFVWAYTNHGAAIVETMRKELARVPGLQVIFDDREKPPPSVADETEIDRALRQLGSAIDKAEHHSNRLESTLQQANIHVTKLEQLSERFSAEEPAQTQDTVTQRLNQIPDAQAMFLIQRTQQRFTTGGSAIDDPVSQLLLELDAATFTIGVQTCINSAIDLANLESSDLGTPEQRKDSQLVLDNRWGRSTQHAICWAMSQCKVTLDPSQDQVVFFQNLTRCGINLSNEGSEFPEYFRSSCLNGQTKPYISREFRKNPEIFTEWCAEVEPCTPNDYECLKQREALTIEGDTQTSDLETGSHRQ